MQDVSARLRTAEENPAAYVSTAPGLPPCCMKNGKQCESISTECATHLEHLCWWETGGWRSESRCPGTPETPEFRTSSNCGSGVEEVLTFKDLFTHKHLYHHRRGWSSSPLRNSRIQLQNTSYEIKASYETTHAQQHTHHTRWHLHALAYTQAHKHTLSEVETEQSRLIFVQGRVKMN